MNKVRGVVNSINQTGIKVGEEWYNFSKFNNVQRPGEGDMVEIEVKDEKWIQALAFVQMAVHNADKQTKITRSGLLNTAVAILRTQNRPVTTTDAIAAARELEPYIYEPPHIPSGADIPY